MESMIENVKKYQDDFKGSRIPAYQKKFIEDRKKILEHDR